MSEDHKASPVDKLKASSLSQDMPQRPVNGIDVAPSGYREVKLTMYLDGKPQTYVHYDAVQLDRLIKYLQECRRQMDGVLPAHPSKKEGKG